MHSEPSLNLVVRRNDEDNTAVLLESLDMLSMQRNVRMEDFMVTVMQTGSKSFEQSGAYPFRVDVIRTDARTLSAAYNEAVRKSVAPWIMFIDYGDLMADVYSMSMILNLLPTEECDILWMPYYAESNDKVRGTFVRMIKDDDEKSSAKLFRTQFLRDQNVLFDESITQDVGEVFLATAKSATVHTRFLKASSPFYTYVHTVSEPPADETEAEIIMRRHRANMATVRNIRKHQTGHLYMQYTMMALCCAYYFLHMKNYGDVTETICHDAIQLILENPAMVEHVKKQDLEVFLYEAGAMVQNLIQQAYLNHGYEMRYDIEGETFWKWIDNRCQPYDIETASKPSIPDRSGRIHGSDTDRVAVFCGTRNVYDSMETAAKSLQYHTPMDRIYFFIEDDEFPHELPENVICRNVSGQTWFDPNGKNYKNAWTYMCLMRAAFAKLMPEEHKVLSLDVDVIVNHDISELWDIDLSEYYYAGVPEVERSTKDYANFGVILMNLDKIRETHIDDAIIDSLNRSRWGCPEQDAFNHFCTGRIYTLPTMYNVTRAGSLTGESDVEKISHYAGIKYWTHYQPFRTFKEMEWRDIMKGRVA